MSNSSTVINNINNTVNGFKSRVDVQIADVNQATAQIKATTEKIFNKITRFKTEMVQNEEKQIAHENVLRIDQIIKEQFSQHITIRRTVMGIVRDFDINLVRNASIQEFSEELWITNSRYWLSYSLIAISAWINNYRELAKNALAESGRKDPVKTTLFFCLFNMRFERVDTARLWFSEYLTSVDPTKLQEETAIMLQAYLAGLFGKDKVLETEVEKIIDSWLVRLSQDESQNKDLADVYKTYLEQMHAVCEFPYEELDNFCKESTVMHQILIGLHKFEQLIELVQQVDVEAVQQNESNYKARLDSILIDLISKYDSEERALREQQEYYHLIIKNEGVVDAAEAQFKEYHKLSHSEENIGRQLVRWAIYDDSSDTNVQVRRFAMQQTKRWFIDAVNGWEEKINKATPVEYTLELDKWKGKTNGEDEAEQIDDMNSFFKINEFTFKYINTYTILALAVAVASAVLGLVSQWYFAFIITGAAGGLLAFLCFRAGKKFEKRVNDAKTHLKHCMNEIAGYKRELQEKKANKARLVEMIKFL